ncbi:MAG: hypothetical protein ACREC0_08915 [Methylocella sp.]
MDLERVADQTHRGPLQRSALRGVWRLPRFRLFDIAAGGIGGNYGNFVERKDSAAVE